jgi:hypothetical protein
VLHNRRKFVVEPQLDDIVGATAPPRQACAERVADPASKTQLHARDADGQRYTE